MPDKCDLGDNFEPTSPKTARKMPQPPLPSTPKLPKTKENLRFFNVFHSPAMVRLRSSQVGSKMAILPLAWLILKVSWPIWVATYHQLGPSFGHLRSNFAGIFNQMAPCTRRNAPKAPKILSAFNLPRFSIPLELHFQCSLFVQCHSVRSNSLREQVPFPQASLSKIFKPPRVFYAQSHTRRIQD